MKVLLINPPVQINMKPEIPPLGISFISSALMKAGHEVDVLDIDGNRYSKDEAAVFIQNADVDIIGIGGLVTVYPSLHWLVPLIKKLKPGIEIILGGAVAASLKKRCFDRFDIDFEVIGEGEITIVELLREISQERDFAKVKGIGYKNNKGEVVFTGRRQLMQSLEGVPMLNDNLFPMATYLKNTEGTLQIHAQRGCPFSCTFCFNCYRVVSNDVRYRPVNNVVDEIEYFKEKYNDTINLYAISGECVTANKEWTIGLCKEILKRNLKINFRVTSRVNTIDTERLEWLKKSGCVMIAFGLESGSQKILKLMKKGATVEQGKKAVSMARKYIKIIRATIMIGYIGEDKGTLQETVRFCKDIGVKPNMFFAMPFPGTVLYEKAIAMGRIKDEEEYLMRLDRQLITLYCVNLTDMPDDEAEKALKTAVRNVKVHYFLKEPWSSFKEIKNRVRNKGLIGTLTTLSKKITGKNNAN